MSITNNNLISFEGQLKAGQRLIKRPDGTFLPIGISEQGLDTSDANATANTLLSGYTAYVDGTKISGTFIPT